jgi:hypothetical protein
MYFPNTKYDNYRYTKEEKRKDRYMKLINRDVWVMYLKAVKYILIVTKRMNIKWVILFFNLFI